MNRHIEKAYKAWRATVQDTMPLRSFILAPPLRVEPRKYAGTGRYKRTAAHKEASRKAALRRWARPGGGRNAPVL